MPERVDGYLPVSRVADLVDRFRLTPSPEGQVILRATGMAMGVVTELPAGAGQVVAGLDLAGSTDARERAAGRPPLRGALSG